jgi:hypothetical protein
MDPLKVYRYGSAQPPQLKKIIESLLSKEATQRVSLAATKELLKL